uniref:Uncharacterized protein n=1 Tax=Sphaerodactylus townsendi TaxID=933632 RepID=A0ACB8EDA3_9SAUR
MIVAHGCKKRDSAQADDKGGCSLSSGKPICKTCEYLLSRATNAIPFGEASLAGLGGVAQGWPERPTEAFATSLSRVAVVQVRCVLLYQGGWWFRDVSCIFFGSEPEEIAGPGAVQLSRQGPLCPFSFSRSKDQRELCLARVS